MVKAKDQFGISGINRNNNKIAAEYRVDPIDRMIKDIESNFQRLREEGSTGAEKNTGRGMGDTFDPSKDFRVNYNQIVLLI